MRRLLLAVPVVALACSAGPIVHDDPEPVGYSSAELVASDPVSKAVAESCTTTSVKGLATQLIEEIQCIKPGSMTSIAKVPNTQLEPAVFPYLQTPAADALKKVAASRSTPLVINSALRTLPQQFLLYRWYQTNRCGIGLAASPGTSNHESGLALDVSDNAAWRSAFQNQSWAWLGASDPVHYDFKGGGTVSLQGLSVLAFQRLWNRNNANDKIAEDGDYGPATETRLMKSPVGGFAKGANCNDPPPAKDAGASEPDAGAPPPPKADASTPIGDDAGAPVGDTPAADQGCNAGGSTPGDFTAFALVGAACLLARRRRRSVTAAG